jgi:hypothetical protein
MKTGFNLIYLNSIDSEVSRWLFKVALREFKREYNPADFVKITEVNYMGLSYDPKKEDFKHSFSVHWEEP